MVKRVLEPGTRLVTRLSSDLHRVYADPGQMEQVLLNLWLSAHDAMPGGGELTTSTRNLELNEDSCRAHPEVQPGAYVELSVTDSGRGIDPSARDHLFEPFFSAGRGERGSLGLAMAYGIVRQHEGCVEVDSAPGAGTTVRLLLPAIVERMAVAVAPDSEPVRGGHETILVGEDDPLTLGFIESTLQGMGYRVLTGGHSDEVMRRFRQRQEGIDLVVLDVVMPSRGGREVAREMKAARPDLKILFVSGYLLPPGPGLEGWPESADFLPKPFSPTSLGRKVREVLDRPARAPK